MPAGQRAIRAADECAASVTREAEDESPMLRVSPAATGRDRLPSEIENARPGDARIAEAGRPQGRGSASPGICVVADLSASDPETIAVGCNSPAPPHAGNAGDEGLVVGIGLRPGTSADVISAAVREVSGHGIVRCLATLDRRADEPGVREAAAVLGVPVLGFPAERLAAVAVPNPAGRVAEALGTPSVAEAAAVLASRHGRLLVPKTVVGGVTVAVAGTGEPTVT